MSCSPTSGQRHRRWCAYGQAWVEISAQIADIQRDLRGVTDPALAYRERYLLAVRQQVAQKLAEFARLAEASTLVTQQAAATAALTNAATMANIVSGGAVQDSTRPPAEAIEALIGAASDGSPLNELFGELFDYADDGRHVRQRFGGGGLNPP